MTQDKALEILKTGANVFLTGEPGAGKTYTVNQLAEYLHSRGRYMAITASTGIAATHINGTTIHSWSGIGIKRELDESDLDIIRYKKYVARKIQDCETLVIDEISMLDCTTIENVDLVMRHVRGSEAPFGGAQVVFVGDFFQLPPVSPGRETKFAFEAIAWKNANLQVCYLTEQHRQNDEVFLAILSSIRSGTTTPAQKDVLKSCMRDVKPATHLYTHNLDVEHLNKIEFDKLTTEEKVYKAEVSGIDFMIEILKKNCLSPEYLKLKVGAVVMFTTNNFQKGYVNGTIGTLVDFGLDGEPIVELKDGSRVEAVYFEWKIEEKGITKASFRQYPLRLAWAITVHKSQGMSLDEATIDLSKTFEYGQGYVAISRVKSLAGLHLSGVNDKVFEVNPKIMEQDKLFRQQSNEVVPAVVIVKEEINVEDIPF